MFEDTAPRLQRVTCAQTGVEVVTPVLPGKLPAEEQARRIAVLLQDLFETERIERYSAWYYTPMALPFARLLEPQPELVVYDCMDQLSAFRGAPPSLRENELRLFAIADLVFTGGQSLFEAKRQDHPSVHLFPSSIDLQHFEAARRSQPEPDDQQLIARPRIGFAGVLDERFDFALLAELQTARPDWQFVLLGPFAKIDPGAVPRAHNLHYLGMKRYEDLPAYFSGWDAAMLPFALNEATRFISPTKTPEYLAAGLPVVSSAIRDVVRPYGELGLITIATTAAEWIAALEHALTSRRSAAELARVDQHLRRSSWDVTWRSMKELMDQARQRRAEAVAAEGELARV